MTRTLAIATLLLVCAPVALYAQPPTPVSPTSQVSFNASTDHTVTDAFGNVIVQRYDLETVAMNALGVIVFTQQLGKPTPNASNVIQVGIGATVAALTGGTIYQARVAAVGPGGVGRSLLSNPFGVPAPKVPAAPTGTPAIQ